MTESVTIGLVGAGFIGQMHALAFRNAAMTAWQPPVAVRLKTVAETDETLGRTIAARYGWENWTADWRDIVEDPEIQLVINAGPNHLHGEPTVAAARAGKHVFCEKPLAASAEEAWRIWKDVAETGVIDLCAFMYRSMPALNLAREMIGSGELGEVRHYRSRFLLTMLTADGRLNWRFSRSKAGPGALGDLGSHHIDQARFLVGEVTKTWSRDAAGAVTDVNDDAFVCAAELENGATASFEASRVAGAHNLGGWIEVDGTRRSIAYHMERLNELVVTEPGKGSRTQMVTGAAHPYADFWLPVGIQGQHPLGWNEIFAHQARHMLAAVALGEPVAPRAGFEDGYRVAETVEAIERSAQSGRFEEVRIRA